MKTQQQRTQMAESAIQMLETAIEFRSKKRIIEAYDYLDDESFSWDGLDVIFMQWDELVDQANEIVYEH